MNLVLVYFPLHADGSQDEYFLVDQRLDTTTQQELVDRTAVLKGFHTMSMKIPKIRS